MDAESEVDEDVFVAIIRSGQRVEGVHIVKTIYVVSTAGQTLAESDVYEQLGPCYLPAVVAQWRGTFAELFEGQVSRRVTNWRDLPADGVLNALYPHSQLFWFLQNYERGVDCYMLPYPRPVSPGAFVRYCVCDIESPWDWFRANEYYFCGVVTNPEWEIASVECRPGARRRLAGGA